MKITLKEALEGFRAESASLGHSAGYTRVNFVYLGKFRAACEAVASDAGQRDLANLTVRAITPDCITRYFTGLQGLCQGSQNRGLSALRAFLSYLEQREYLASGAVAKLLKGRKAKAALRKRKHYIPAGQFGEMLELSGRRHAADRAAMAVALYTLARQGEIASLRLKDVDFENGVIRIYRSKRSRWTEVTMCPELVEELSGWLSAYADETGCWSWSRMNPAWHLIPHLGVVRNPGTFKSELITWRPEPERPAGRMENVVKSALDVLGADTEDGKYVKHLGEGMHTIRRSGARAMLDYLTDELGSEKALLQVSIMLDHDDPKMTLLYIGRDVERDRLNDYLKTGSMYGPSHRAGRPGNVVPLRREAMG